jgi:2-polyprenyl-3-methyl-5-hydroxy-6-metoxy-1,4-benzoquinol methylase
MDNLKLQARFSDRTTPSNVGLVPSARVRKIMQSFSDAQGWRIIDWGGGTGVISAPLSAANEVCVVDCSLEQLKVAAGIGRKTCLIKEDGECPAGLKGWADGVLCGEVIEHVVDTDHFLHHINQCMKMGGRLVLTTPNIYNLLTPALWLLDRPPMFAARYRSEHVRDFTVKTLRLALQNNGFEVQRIRGTTLLSIPFPMPGGEFLADLFPRLSEQLVAVAVKKAESAYDPDRAMQGRLEDEPLAGAFQRKK